jgi:hypothetical protein
MSAVETVQLLVAALLAHVMVRQLEWPLAVAKSATSSELVPLLALVLAVAQEV